MLASNPPRDIQVKLIRRWEGVASKRRPARPENSSDDRLVMPKNEKFNGSDNRPLSLTDSGA